MTAQFRRTRRRLTPLLLAAGLVAGSAFCPPSALAQRRGPNEPAAEEAPADAKSGRPLDGYLGTLVLVGLAFFIIGKSARR
jgi:hypothetical protein